MILRMAAVGHHGDLVGALVIVMPPVVRTFEALSGASSRPQFLLPLSRLLIGPFVVVVKKVVR